VVDYDRFHWPIWDEAGLKLMFEDDVAFPNALCHHLWESKSYAKYFKEGGFDETLEDILSRKSTYRRLIQEYV